jgi:hypothetical protein
MHDKTFEKRTSFDNTASAQSLHNTAWGEAVEKERFLRRAYFIITLITILGSAYYLNNHLNEMENNISTKLIRVNQAPVSPDNPPNYLK